jgi:two-component system NtrC family sensor kinase
MARLTPEKPMSATSVPFLNRFSFKIIAGVISMLFLVGIPFFILFLQYHRSQLLDTMEKSTSDMGRILTHQLEVSVLEWRNHDLARIIEYLSKNGDARKIMVINGDSRVVHSSDGTDLGRILSRHADPGCRECHVSVALKDTIYLNDLQGHPYYRTVTVIQNRPACFSCHDPRASVIGILVMDFAQETLQGRIRSGTMWMLFMGGAMLVLTIGVLYALLNYLVLRKLKRFDEVTEEIGQSRFKQVDMPGKDEFSQLAASFNTMSRRLGTAMDEIRESKDYLECVINNINDEIVVLDPKFEVVTANAAYARRMQTAASESAGVSPRQISQDHPNEACACKATFQDGLVHKVVQTVMDDDGKEKHIEVFSSPMRNDAGKVYQVIEVRRDITERRLLEANLGHSEKLVSMGLLASGLSHEINNPLASIATFIEGLRRRLSRSQDGSIENWDGLEYSLSLIQKEIERAKDVTRRLLIMAQKDEYGPSLVNLHESLRETALLVHYEASRRGIEITVDEHSDVPTLKLSEAQVRQIFLNLLMNSLQAGHEGGHIRCRTWLSDGRAFAAVADDGAGIDSADQMKIFEPFFSKKAMGQGTGLGLFICKSIISGWGGGIEVDSRVGHGATFTLWVPIAK